jgi:hypothetical protein
MMESGRRGCASFATGPAKEFLQDQRAQTQDPGHGQEL